MMLTSKPGYLIRRRLRSLSTLPVMLLSLTLPARGDKEAPADPAHLAEITRLRDDAQ